MWGEDNDFNVQAMITRLMWTIWTLLSAVRERPLNLITHSLTIVEIRWSCDCFISTMGFPTLAVRHLYIESGPRQFPCQLPDCAIVPLSIRLLLCWKHVLSIHSLSHVAQSDLTLLGTKKGLKSSISFFHSETQCAIIPNQVSEFNYN